MPGFSSSGQNRILVPAGALLLALVLVAGCAHSGTGIPPASYPVTPSPGETAPGPGVNLTTISAAQPDTPHPSLHLPNTTCGDPSRSGAGASSPDGACPAPSRLTLIFIDVEQGDAILVRTSSNHTMLIDAGRPEHSGDVLAALRGQGVTSLDLLVASHPHGDHIGSMRAVIDIFPVQQFIEGPAPCDSSECRSLKSALAKKNIPTRIVRSGDTIPLDPSVNITVLSPPGTLYDEVNDNSLVLRLVYGTTSFLLTGDAGKAAEEGMIAAGLPLQSDLLKVGHHGLSSSTTAAFVTRVSPEVSIISLQKSSQPTHPDPAVIRRLTAGGSAVYRTDTSGTITVVSDGSRLSVLTARNATPVYYPASPTAGAGA